MPRSLPIAFVMLLATPFLALGGLGSDAAAAPKPVAAKPAMKGVGAHVVTKRGVPAIQLKHGTKQPASDPPAQNPPAWTAPIVAPIEGELEVTPLAPYAGPVGISTLDARLRTVATAFQSVGFHFVGSGAIRLSMPSTATGGSDLMVSCEGDLPSKLSVTASMYTGGSSGSWLLMELVNVSNKAKFVVMPGGLPPNTIFEVGISSDSNASWRVDRCTIERV